ncbi:hypothetical protein FQR65_LT07942 [Abscondita terminalis]|nr:hypothetical protein FQR65_LT07942 [Abscondita terminalis]
MRHRQNITKDSSSAFLTRKNEKEKTQAVRSASLNHALANFIKKLQYKTGTIGHASYISFLCILQVRLHYVSKLFDLVLEHGPSIGYSYALWANIMEFINITLGAFSVYYLQSMFPCKVPWKNTDLPNKNKSDCSPFLALTYFRENVEQPTSDDAWNILLVGSANGKQVLAMILIWSVILAMSWCGYHSFHTKMTKIEIFILIVWCYVYLLILLDFKSYDISIEEMAHKLMILTNVLRHVLTPNVVCTTVWIAAINSSHSIPNTDAIIVYSFKIVTLSALIIWVPVLLKTTKKFYGTYGLHCLNITGFEVLFAMVPDILTRKPFPCITNILWFSTLLFHSFASALYTFTATVDSFADAFPKLKQFRGQFCLFTAISCLLINLFYTTNLSVVFMNVWIDFGNVIVTDVMVTLSITALVFMYSIQNITDDYHFAFGTPPFRLWIQLWKTLPFISLFHSVLGIYQHVTSKNVTRYNSVLLIVSSVISLMILMPIFAVLMFKYLVLLKQHNLSTILKPDPDWGYYIKSERKHRDHFNPQAEVRYKTNQLQCKHNCLLNSSNFKKLNELNELRLEKMFEEIYTDSGHT